MAGPIGDPSATGTGIATPVMVGEGQVHGQTGVPSDTTLTPTPTVTTTRTIITNDAATIATIPAAGVAVCGCHCDGSCDETISITVNTVVAAGGHGLEAQLAANTHHNRGSGAARKKQRVLV